VRSNPVLRERGAEQTVHVTNAELFFDLVYVFAFTQVSQHLYGHPTLVGGLQTAVLFLALWWPWSQTAWATNWVDPERVPVVVLLSVLMVISLVMSAAIPEAFEERGLSFAVAYLCLQLLRGGFMVWAFGWSDAMGRNFAQQFAWVAIAGLAWVAGGLVHEANVRLAIWAGALVIEYGVPLLGFRLPGVEPIQIESWELAGAHLAERCQLVLMISFGETMLRIGEAFTEHRGGTEVDIAFVVGFILIFALWTMYFLHHAERSIETIGSVGMDVARLGRAAFTYGHAVMVGADIVVAVAIHKAVEEPNASVSVSFAVLCLGGPALYLLGIAMSKRWLGHGRSWPPLVGAAALLVLGIPAAQGTRLTELIAATVVASVLSLVSARDAAREEPAA